MKLIATNPGIRGGAPCIAGTNLEPRWVAERFAAGESIAALADDYNLSLAQVEAALRYELRGEVARLELHFEREYALGETPFARLFGSWPGGK